MTSYHSIERVLERTNIKTADKAARFLENAAVRGRIADDFNGNEHTWLAAREHDGYSAVAYNGYCVIMREDKYVITMYELPAWFGKQLHAGKDRIRNPRRYQRMHSSVQSSGTLYYA